MAELAAEHAPRFFALCRVDAEADDGGVLGWGIEAREGEVIVCGGSGSRILGRCSSVDQARRLFGRSRNVEVIWLDGRDGVARRSSDLSHVRPMPLAISSC